MVLKPNKKKFIVAILPFSIPMFAFIAQYLIVVPRNPFFDCLMFIFMLVVLVMSVPISPLIHIFGIKTAGDFLSNLPDSIGGFVFLAFVYFVFIYFIISLFERKSG